MLEDIDATLGNQRLETPRRRQSPPQAQSAQRNRIKPLKTVQMRESFQGPCPVDAGLVVCWGRHSFARLGGGAAFSFRGPALAPTDAGALAVGEAWPAGVRSRHRRLVASDRIRTAAFRRHFRPAEAPANSGSHCQFRAFCMVLSSGSRVAIPSQLDRYGHPVRNEVAKICTSRRS